MALRWTMGEGVVQVDADGLQERFTTVLVEAELEQVANAQAVAVAVYAGVGVADRLRAAEGMAVVLQVAGSPAGRCVAGTVVDATASSVTVSAPGGRWVVRTGAIEIARGLPAGHRPARGAVAQRLGLAAQLRALVGEWVVVAVAGEELPGILRRVGADHIEVGVDEGTAVIPFAAFGWVRARP